MENNLAIKLTKFGGTEVCLAHYSFVHASLIPAVISLVGADRT
jgi:hypothetical protein